MAVPLPITGAWTGCVVAFLLGLRFWPSFAAITAGDLKARKIGNAYRISKEALEEFLKS